ncbi:hypothetical protein WJX81_001395 [Elliptochloris bilobata]|uniref:Thioredoxin domain-containing protein n=1 Tax=Elliptochloris bilobata TaxID=381761 RepID=A0AAW1S0V4_9CHLO
MMRAARRAARLHAVAAKIDKLNTEQLEVAIQERDRPLIVDFFATWCGPCVLLAKELESVAEELGEAVRVVKVDVDEEQALASHLQIQGLPTLVFIGMDKEKPALRLEGLLPASAIKEVLVDLTSPKVAT